MAPEAASSAYRIYGAEISPFSVKVRSYFRFKNVPHRWIVRNAASMGEYQKYAKIPIIPLVVTPDEQALQDSTPIMAFVDGLAPEPSTHPSDPVARFVSILLEEFGDEWGNKWMFHLRWAREEDCRSASGRAATMMAPKGDEDARLAIRAQFMERMQGRLHFVGSNETTGPQIERSFRDALDRLEVHLANRPYLFGGRPSWADFGLWGQIYNAWTDPTGGAWVEGGAPNVLDWVHRMTWPTIEGDWEDWSSVEATLAPFLAEQVGALFCPWTVANAAAFAAGEASFSVALAGRTFTQQPQKYHAKSLAVLRERYRAAEDKARLDPVLAEAGCLETLRAGEA
ncbi:MAG: glutathione S-transferase family protein [Myxococcota bacterium]